MKKINKTNTTTTSTPAFRTKLYKFAPRTRVAAAAAGVVVVVVVVVNVMRRIAT